MEGAGRKFAPYFRMGQAFQGFITGELTSGKTSRINRGIILEYMVKRAAKADEWFMEGQRLQYGECFISRKETARDCNITENQARDAISWLELHGHIERQKHDEAPNSVGTFYIVSGLRCPEEYEITRGEDAENTDITGKNADIVPIKPPSTAQKPPSENSEKSKALSMFLDAGGTENHQNNIRELPLERKDIRTKDSNIEPKNRILCDFEQFRSPQMLENYILSATQRSKHERKKYNCPFCRSGTGKNGTGALQIDKKRGGVKWHCFSCGLDGDIYDFAGQLHHTQDKIEQYKIVSEFFQGNSSRQGIGS